MTSNRPSGLSARARTRPADLTVAAPAGATALGEGFFDAGLPHPRDLDAAVQERRRAFLKLAAGV